MYLPHMRRAWVKRWCTHRLASCNRLLSNTIPPLNETPPLQACRPVSSTTQSYPRRQDTQRLALMTNACEQHSVDWMNKVANVGNEYTNMQPP